MGVRFQKKVGNTFKRQVMAAQSDLFSFIALMVGNTSDAWDVLQNTNLALMKKAEQYDSGRPFQAWAKSIAYYEVLTFRQRQRRERLVFDDDMLDQIAAKLVREESDEEIRTRRHTALERCLSKLAPAQQTLVAQRYQEGVSVGRLAQERACSETAVSTLLYRIRKVLALCIQGEISQEARA